MLVCIEGCIGVGKSTLVEKLLYLLQGKPFYEEVDTNPFLLDLYQDPTRYPLHVQGTFLFLQDRQMRQAQEYSQAGNLAICDFHPLKSMVFSNIILEKEDRDLVAKLYDRLFSAYRQADLLVYLKAEHKTILSRIKKRNDPYTQTIDPNYITQICSEYEVFLSQYPGNMLPIDNSSLDYAGDLSALQSVVNKITDRLDITPYLKAG